MPATPPAAPAEFGDFVADHWERWHRFAYSVTGDAEDAKDAVQDALAGCYRRWPQIAAGNPDAYVRRSIVNAHIDRWRATGRVQATDDLDVLARPAPIPDLDAALAAITGGTRVRMPSRVNGLGCPAQPRHAAGQGRGTGVRRRVGEPVCRARRVGSSGLRPSCRWRSRWWPWSPR